MTFMRHDTGAVAPLRACTGATGSARMPTGKDPR
jgi:hypothetical protein